MSSLRNDVSVDTVAASNMHHGSYEPARKAFEMSGRSSVPASLCLWEGPPLYIVPGIPKF